MKILSLQEERARILSEMAQIDLMIRGHVSSQTYSVVRNGQKVLQGPYFLLQRRENGKNNCQRIAEDQIQSIIAAVENHKRFQTLAARYAELTEQQTWAAQAPEIKKKFRRFWKPSCPKPPPSSPTSRSTD